MSLVKEITSLKAITEDNPLNLTKIAENHCAN